MKPKVLFLCVANSARSQMAEAMGNHFWGEQFQFLSAGSHPGTPHPIALSTLKNKGIDTEKLHSKPMSDFKLDEMDYVITLCAEEYCPTIRGNKIHWPFSDPSDCIHSEQPQAFDQTYEKIKTKIGLFFTHQVN